MATRVACLACGVFLNGVATGAYIGAGLGPGPRDGLMTGLAARGHSIRVVRTGLELTVLATGWLLGGTVGVGTVVYALSIGPLAHVFIPLFSVRDRRLESAAPSRRRGVVWTEERVRAKRARRGKAAPSPAASGPSGSEVRGQAAGRETTARSGANRETP
jgi:hypothetical protein